MLVPTGSFHGSFPASGTWLREPSLVDSSLLYWIEDAGPEIYSYSEWIGWSALRRHELRGNQTFGERLLA